MRRHWPALLLVAYGGAFALAAFGQGLPVFDDHPGQFFRLWHALDRSLPGGHGAADWNPDWWGGYPELQFYPPGFAMLGATIRAATLWRLPVETVYRVLCAAILLLPAVTTYWLVTRLTTDPVLALPPAFLALTLSAGLRGGVEESVRWGMLTSRLALAALPLLLLSTRRWVDDGRRPAWAPPLAAGAVLAHPAGGVAGGVLLALAALIAALLRPARARLAETAMVAGLGLGLTAWWTLPLLIRHRWLVPLTWGPQGLGALTQEIASRPLIAVLLAAGLAGWIAVWRRRRPFDALVAALPLALAGALALNSWAFGHGWSPLEPARLADAVVLAAVWSAAHALGALVARPAVARRSRARRPSRTGRGAVAVVAVAMAAAVLLALADGRGARGEPTLTLWPTGDGWPTLDEVSRRHDLPALWGALRNGRDRVLFLTSGLRLDGPGPWYAPHSHVTSLTPLFAGREIVNGTFTHPSPLAARVYLGPPPGDAAGSSHSRVGVLAEQLDGRQLLGRSWEQLSPSSFDLLARRLRIATVVVPSPDAGRAAHFLAGLYGPGRPVAGFTLFERRQYPWPTVERIDHRRFRVSLSPEQGIWIPTGVVAYPLWQVKSPAGRLATRSDALGLLEFRVPIDVFEAELVYGEGWPEWVGLALALASGAVWLIWAWTGRSARRTGRQGRAAP